jgi:flagellar biogenesis protein FliO
MREEALNIVQATRVWSVLQETLERLKARITAVRPPRRLKVSEAVPLGDKRFVAVVQFERKRYLIGGAPNSLVLLARLDEDPTTSFCDALSVAQQGNA